MARSVSVDTSAWYAPIDRRDTDHARVAVTEEREPTETITEDELVRIAGFGILPND